MKYRLNLSLYILLILMLFQWNSVYSQENKKEYEFSPFIWKSEAPENCPFERSKAIEFSLQKGESLTLNGDLKDI
jgi:hypothetical protein